MVLFQLSQECTKKAKLHFRRTAWILYIIEETLQTPNPSLSWYLIYGAVTNLRKVFAREWMESCSDKQIDIWICGFPNILLSIKGAPWSLQLLFSPNVSHLEEAAEGRSYKLRNRTSCLRLLLWAFVSCCVLYDILRSFFYFVVFNSFSNKQLDILRAYLFLWFSITPVVTVWAVKSIFKRRQTLSVLHTYTLQAKV